ncbi:hypothetical protein AG0111_0g2665 [Alternaria gaisen]|uniref:Uncharacterized protein n=1 Tax=Alternaria gaisen TaxID=167740 RepID=A0ACB6FY72_9PLEO|nr:hypothetical protein AG0111_0g2665 [Alternaria gaisen]
MNHMTSTSEILRTDLARTLGFPNYPHDAAAEPYLNYLTNRCIGSDTMEAYIRLLIRVVKYFDGVPAGSSVMRSIQGLLDVESSSPAYIQQSHEDVEDTVLYVIGTWTLLLSSFIHVPLAGGLRKVTAAYNLRTHGSACGNQPYGEDLARLVLRSGLLPVPIHYLPPDHTICKNGSFQSAAMLSPFPRPLSASFSTSQVDAGASASTCIDDDLQRRVSLGFLHDLDSLESLTIDATRLNAYTLNVFGAVDIAWTHNVSRHLSLSKRDGRHILEIFSLPCALDATSLKLGGITNDLAQEIRETYALLFNASHKIPRHTKLARILGVGSFCWCRFCSMRRHRNHAIMSYKRFSKHRTLGAKKAQRTHSSEYDPLLVKLMSSQSSEWTPDMFPHLWARIMILEEHLEEAKPWSVWVLFRDRRDTLQFWTFLWVPQGYLLPRD